MKELEMEGRRVERENWHEEKMLSMMLTVMQQNRGHNPHRHFTPQDDPTSFSSMGDDDPTSFSATQAVLSGST